MSTLSPPPLPGASRAPGKPPRNWLQRNLKWALPLAAVLIVVSWLLLNWLGLRQMAAPLEASEPYRQAIARAAQHRQVQQALGEPIKAEPFPFGSIGGSGGMTNASPVRTARGGSTWMRIVASIGPSTSCRCTCPASMYRWTCVPRTRKLVH
jgi:hypothetical protein